MRVLDLFCGAGGASAGYAAAAADLGVTVEVVGVDVLAQPRYPYEFIQGDALSVLDDVAFVSSFDFVHASPPCQAYSHASQYRRNAGVAYPDLVALTRSGLDVCGVPWVIENVPGSPLRKDLSLCGCYFDLELRRERWFETSWNAFRMMRPHNHPHPVPCVVGSGTPGPVRAALGRNTGIAELRACMGIDWMNRRELSLSIPPAYSRFVLLVAASDGVLRCARARV